MGVTICPEVSVEKELTEKRLAKLRWGEAPMETSILMIWHVEKWCSPLLSHFMEISAKIIAAGHSGIA